MVRSTTAVLSVVLVASTVHSVSVLSRAEAQPNAIETAPSATFSHTAIYVQDIPRSAAFYQTIVGLTPMRDPFNDSVHVWLQTGDHAQLHIIGGATAPANPSNNVHSAFSVPSVEEMIARLNRSTIRHFNDKREEGKTTLRPDGVKQIYFQDPDGYWIEVNDERPISR